MGKTNKNYCPSLRNTKFSQRDQPYNIRSKMDEKYLCDVTGEPCVARSVESRDAGPRGLETIYTAVIDNDIMSKCPLARFPREMHQRFKRDLENWRGLVGY